MFENAKSESTAVKRFDFDGNAIRTTTIDGQPWFVAADVARTLGYGGGARNAVERVPDRMKGVAEINTPGGLQKLVMLSEPGVYRLVMRSRMPHAEAFQDWIAEEVVPSIRKTGAYAVADKPKARNADLDAIRSMLDAIEETRAEQERQAEQLSVVSEALQDHDARLRAIDGRHDWYSALAYASKYGLPTSSTWLNRLGRTAGQIGRSHGLVAQKVQHAYFPPVNSWPEWVWTEAVEVRRAAGEDML